MAGFLQQVVRRGRLLFALDRVRQEHRRAVVSPEGPFLMQIMLT